MSDDPSRPLTDEEVRKVLDEDRCPRCGGYTVEFHSTHERDSTNDYRDCSKCKWTLGEWQVWELHEKEMKELREKQIR